jgi:hypothetical protein
VVALVWFRRVFLGIGMFRISLLLSLATWYPVSVAAPDSFAMSDGSAGPTCANFVSMGQLAWGRPGGDWTDSKGNLYGRDSFASQAVSESTTTQVIDWDVTKLVQGYIDSHDRNAAMLLRPQSGAKNGIVDFHSRESPVSSRWPMLKLKWADGSQSRLSPAADTYLDCTSISSLGARTSMQVSDSQSTLLRFVLPLSTSGLQQAVLYLVSDKQYYGGSQIGVYKAAPSYSRAKGDIQNGLAKNYALDGGIEKDPDVVFATGFENFAWILDWSYYDPRSSTETISSDDARLFVPLVGKALRVRLEKGKNLALDLRYALSAWGVEPEEIYFRYYLRFGSDWNPSLDGGKMPGITGTYGRGGWGMRKSDGYNGWSVRGGFAARPPSDSSVVGMTAIGSYAYHVDIDASGDYWGWNEGPTGLLQNNQWYAVEQYVKLNTLGERDGIFRAWIDGRQVFEKTDVRFRLTSKLKIENIWMDVYHGGTSVAPQDMTLYIDNVVIARKYIGPLQR